MYLISRQISKKTDGRGQLHRDHKETPRQLRVRVVGRGRQRLRLIPAAVHALMYLVPTPLRSNCAGLQSTEHCDLTDRKKRFEFEIVRRYVNSEE